MSFWLSTIWVISCLEARIIEKDGIQGCISYGSRIYAVEKSLWDMVDRRHQEYSEMCQNNQSKTYLSCTIMERAEAMSAENNKWIDRVGRQYECWKNGYDTVNDLKNIITGLKQVVETERREQILRFGRWP